MTLPRVVQDAVDVADRTGGEYKYGFAVKNAWTTIRDHLMSQEAEIGRLEAMRLSERLAGNALADCARDFERQRIRTESAESRLAAANALLLRYCVQIGELTKGLDPHDPIYFDIQRLGADYMTHLQGAGDESIAAPLPDTKSGTAVP